MSERIHSTTPAAKTASARKFIPMMAGTAILLVVAGVWLQFFRAQPAASQTAPPEAGKSTLSNTANNTRILAKVNGQSIPYDVVARECVARHGQEVLDTMINRLLIQQECEKRGITISLEEVEQEVAASAKKFNLPLDTWYKMLESERKLTREQYHQDVIWPMLALKKLAGQEMTVTEDDMRIGFEREYGPRVKARLILIEGNMRQAGQIWERCQNNPDDFDRIAREVSADPNTRPLGGVIPPIKKHAGTPQVEEQAFKMKVGEVSPVIQVQESRYVILKCEGFTEPVVTDIRDVWEDLRGMLIEEKTQKAVAKVFETIKDQARVDNLLTNRSTGGQMIQQTGGNAAGTATLKGPPASASRGAPASR